MNKTFIASLENHNVYLISNDDVSFYLNCLKDKNETTNITMDIDYKKKNSINDIVNYYQKIDNYNITLVVPTDNFIEKKEKYKTQSNTLSSIINFTYKLLTKNGLTIKNNINIIKHSNIKSEFVNFFISKFSNRVRLISIDDLVREEVPYNKVSAANINFVIGRPELDLTIKEDEMQEIIDTTKEVTEKPVSNKKNRLAFVATSGFVSYYLLGFLTAIITLLVITMLVRR